MKTGIKQEIKVLDGNHTAAYGALICQPHVVAVYPITPQSPVGETLSQFHAEGLLDAEFVTVEGETLIFKKQNKECKIVINKLKDSAEVLKQNKVVNPEYSKKQGDVLINVFYDK